MRKAVAKIKADRSFAGAAGLVWEFAGKRLQDRRDATASPRSLIDSGEYDQALSELQGLLHQLASGTERHFRVALLRVEALFKSGRAKDAAVALAELENACGPSALTRFWAARLNLFAARPQAALDACTQAQMDPALRSEAKQAVRSLNRMRAEALCLLQRPDEARLFLQANLGGLPENADIVALRRTVDSPAAVESFLTILQPWLHMQGQLPLVALFQFSLACRDYGMMEMAVAAARQRFLSGAARAWFGENPPLPRGSWRLAAERALLDLQDGFARLEQEFFLVSGTLLGCVREGGILAHDKDLDVGVFTHLAPDALREAIAGWGQFKIRPLRTDRMIQVEHANGVLIDVFLHWEEDGLIFHEGQKARWWNKSFALKDARFLGRTFRVPADPETYLTENYGAGWRVPDRNFETFTDTPNMLRADSDHMAWYFLTKLYDYFYWGKPVQFAKAWRGLQNFSQPDPALRAAAERILASLPESTS